MQTPDLGPDPMLPEDAAWRPTALQRLWADARPGIRRLLRRRVNPSNEARINLAKVIDRAGGRIVVGPYTYGRPKIRFHETGASLTLGRYGSVADGVEIFLGGNHRLDWVTTYPFPALPEMWPEGRHVPGSHAGKGDVHIGHDVWLGSQCLVLSGVTIGHGAVIGARAVVTRDVPPYAIVAGNPARIVRYRFPPEQIDALLASAWWLLPKERIRGLIPMLMSGDIDGFCRQVRT